MKIKSRLFQVHNRKRRDVLSNFKALVADLNLGQPENYISGIYDP
jgi:hypothetical protein